jgi:hypothetical protein
MPGFNVLNAFRQQFLLLFDVLVGIRTVVFSFSVSLVDVQNPVLGLFDSGVAAVDFTVDADGLVAGDAVEFNGSLGVVRAETKVYRLVPELHPLVLAHNRMEFFIRVQLMELVVALRTKVQIVVFTVNDSNFIAVEVLTAEVLKVVDGVDLEFDEDLGLDLVLIKQDIFVPVISHPLVQVFDYQGIVVAF